MEKSPLLTKSMDFALKVIEACRKMNENRCETVLTRQLLKSGTSIGANIREAFYAQSRLDFISKMQISLKECSETEYWLELLNRSGYSETYELIGSCAELKRMLVATIKTSKQV